MKALTVYMEEDEFNSFKLNKNELYFSELKKEIIAEQGIRAMDKCLEIAQKNGLSEMSLEEINNEIKLFRAGE